MRCVSSRSEVEIVKVPRSTRSIASKIDANSNALIKKSLINDSNANSSLFENFKSTAFYKGWSRFKLRADAYFGLRRSN